MRSNKYRVIVPCALAVILLAAGFWMMARSIQRVNYYSEAVGQAQQALAAAAPAPADQMEADVEALQEENAALQQDVLALQEEQAVLDTATEQLRSRYEELEAQEDTPYYRTILESLREGMNRVEEYIRDAE